MEGGRERSDSVSSTGSSSSSVASFSSYSSSSSIDSEEEGEEGGEEEGNNDEKEEVEEEQEEEKDGKQARGNESKLEEGGRKGGKVRGKGRGVVYTIRFEEHSVSSLPHSSSSHHHRHHRHHHHHHHHHNKKKNIFKTLSHVAGGAATTGKDGMEDGKEEGTEEGEEGVFAALEAYMQQQQKPVDASSLQPSSSISTTTTIKATLRVVDPPLPLLAHVLAGTDAVSVDWEVRKEGRREGWKEGGFIVLNL